MLLEELHYLYDQVEYADPVAANPDTIKDQMSENNVSLHFSPSVLLLYSSANKPAPGLLQSVQILAMHYPTLWPTASY